ncbi:hypothetical protein BKA04_000650 [Cryobacterium mesophilum]|uniref:DUF4232 domain-containing protein n=1 Tax=Terrimesophilobacter mesophilus TaxID=433647 RepID=A0A4R8V8U0_9MICO|nr:DUF4232 domain-containing protein [Terrimesophilobacter mesophilus]MBB5632427.1 hypothetical protein [Terrimesophilobacter mesophilus]TFB79259.1 DUF4232 domain-containing protein [Terrimesophilobacter mesophilus]
MRYPPVLIVSIAAVALLAGCSTVSASPSPSAPVTAPSSSPSAAEETFTAGAPDGQCLTADLSASIQPASSTAGHIHDVITLTNNGAPCVLEGYPTVAVSSGGSQVGAAAEDDSSAIPAPITLAAGGTAEAQLTAVDIDPGGGPLGDACSLDVGDAVLVTPPHSMIALSVAEAGFPACTSGTPWMTVGPVTGG